MFHSGSGQMHRFYMVHVFADHLRKWISNNRPKVLIVERPFTRQDKPKEQDNSNNSKNMNSFQTNSASQKTNGAYLNFSNFRFDREAINRCLVHR